MDEASGKGRSLLQVLTKRIILDPPGEILEHELNSLLVRLCSLVEGSFTPGNGEGGSEQVPLGASVFQKPPTDNVERFLSILRIDSKEKVNTLGVMQTSK